MSHQTSLKELIHSDQFLSHAALIQSLFDHGANAFKIITAVFQSRQVIFWHELLRFKSIVPGVPLVKSIAIALRPHGPSWLGDLLFRVCT